MFNTKSFLNIFKKIAILSFYVFSLLLIISCKSCTTSPEQGDLSGTVLLELEEDNSGITIGVYHLAELDPKIVEINNEYDHPLIGVIINQHTEFDHRFGNLIKSTTTNASGHFNINDIPTGKYNVVAIKDSFGFKYMYEINVSKGDNELSENIALYEEHHLNQEDITEDWIFQTDHHYIIGSEEENSINFAPDTNLEIQPGAVVRINPEVDLTIHGTLTAQGEENNMFWVTSNDGFSQDPIPNTLNRDEVELYHRMELTENCNIKNDLIEWGKWDWANTGLYNETDGFSISYCIFRNSVCGFHSNTSTSTTVNNLLCENIYNESSAGIYFEQVEDGKIEKNIVSDCENGIKIKNESNSLIKNNYITNRNTGIDISYSSSAEIHNNEIYECENGIYICEFSEAIIYNNFLESTNSIVMNDLDYEFCINYNNLNFLNFSFQMLTDCNRDIDAVNNYFFTIYETEIQESIFDKNDVEPSQQQYYGEVIFEPFLTEEYPYAGIQQN